MIDSAAVRRVLYSDPIWSAYAIADLQPAFERNCTWVIGDDETSEGLALIYRGLTPPVLLTVGPSQAVAAALALADLPPVAYLSIRNEHEAAIGAWYDNSADRRQMWRMVLRRAQQIDVPGVHGMVRLHSDDAGRLKGLYAVGGQFTPEAFDAYQLEDGVFYGIEDDDGALLAAGGTHIVDWDAGIGAIGNFYTHPDQRGQGYASALLAAIVRDLRARYVDTIVLNVDQRNSNASGLYTRHGFVIHCPFVEGIAMLKSSVSWTVSQ
jgi:ribosomal protein S18 acetylase RimI-like enzyme